MTHGMKQLTLRLTDEEYTSIVRAARAVEDMTGDYRPSDAEVMRVAIMHGLAQARETISDARQSGAEYKDEVSND